MKVIQDVWIINDQGITLFHRVFDPKIDEQLFGGMMTALNILAQQLADGELSSFEVQSKRFILKKQYNLFFVVNSSIETTVKKVNKPLNKIVSRFFQSYPLESIQNWYGDSDFFLDFEKEIKEFLEDPV